MPANSVQHLSTSERVQRTFTRMIPEMSASTFRAFGQWNFFNQRIYYFLSNYETWDGALKICAAMKTELLVINSKGERRVVRSAERTMGTTLAPLQDLYIRRCRSRASKIMRDPYLPSNGLFQLLGSSKRLRSHAVKTERVRRSFFPQAIRIVNFCNSRD
ncbi:uncharacterized protein LOC144610555 [Rhinoraja longicauda]